MKFYKATGDIERIKGQFGAEEIEPDEIKGLFGVKGQILNILESADEWRI
jgi:hypothetical protein